MAMYPTPPPDTTEFEPSDEQLRREEALRRYNRLNIYVPVGIAVAIAVGLLVLMLVGIFAPGLVGAEEFLSGLADTILILWMMPMMVLCAIVPIAYVGYLVNRRQRRSMLPPDSPLLRHSRTQMALWQAQHILDRISKKVDESADQAARPFIAVEAIEAYLLAWLDILTRPFRSNHDHDPNGADELDGPDGAA